MSMHRDTQFLVAAISWWISAQQATSNLRLSLVPGPFWSKHGEEGSGDSGQNVGTQWNAIMGILRNCLLAMRADCTYILAAVEIVVRTSSILKQSSLI